MIFGSIILLTALTLSAVAAYYSIAGLVAIFSAAPIPIMIMGGALEVGKIVSTVFLHNNWKRLTWAYKTYLVPAVIILMLLTSLGIFGLLSKAHSDQSLVSGDAMSKVAIYDEKIKTLKENIESAKKTLQQMNMQVDARLNRSDSESGAERAVAIRKQQAKERAELQKEIAGAQKEIIKLQEERAPIAAEFRKVEAEVGPIRYIAALIYGDSPDTNLLERAVRWVIILIVVVFDPLALTLILAANKQFEWARAGRGGWVHDEEEKIAAAVAVTQEPPAESPPQQDLELDDRAAMNIVAEPPVVEIRPFTEEEIAALGVADTAPTVVDTVDSAEEFFDKAHIIAKALDINDELNRAQQANTAVAEIEQPTADLDIPILENEEMWAQRVIDENLHEETVNDLYVADVGNKPTAEEIVPEYEADTGPLTQDQIAQIQDTVVEEETPPPSEEPPVNDFDIPIRRGADYAVRYKGKVYNLDAFNKLHPSMAVAADNGTPEIASQCGFGERFPNNPIKGDMFIRTDYLPDRLFKWNGAKWIELDKNSTDSYTYNQAYIQHLIKKLEAGEYDIEELNAAEQAQVEQQIEEILKTKRGQ